MRNNHESNDRDGSFASSTGVVLVNQLLSESLIMKIAKTAQFPWENEQYSAKLW